MYHTVSYLTDGEGLLIIINNLRPVIMVNAYNINSYVYVASRRPAPARLCQKTTWAAIFL